MKKSMLIALCFAVFLSLFCYPLKKIEMKTFLAEKEDDANYQFYMATDCALDDDLNLYIVDAKECVIKKYDKSGKFVLSFGSKGGGPGEIGFPNGIEFSGGKIYIPQHTRINVFSTSGVYEKSLSYPPKMQLGKFKLLNDKIGVVYGFCGEKLQLISYSLDDPSKKIKSLASAEYASYSTDNTGIAVAKNNIKFEVLKNDEIIFGSDDELKIKKYSLRNDSVKTIITYNYTRRKFPDETIKAIEESLKARGQSNQPPIPEYLPMIKALTVDDNGNIWFYISSNEKNGLLKFDKNGKFLDDYQLKQGNLYVVGGKIIIKKNFIYSFGVSRGEGVKILRGTLE